MLTLLLSLSFWSWLYLKCSKEWPHKSPEWWSRAVTMLHGSAASVLGAWLCGAPSLERCNMPIGILHYVLMVWSWGYFAFDLMWCLYFWPHNWLMLFHHAGALGGITLYMGKPNSGCTLPCAVTFLEITNPLLQTRWFLRNEGYDKNIFYTIIEVTYLSLFLGLRGILGTYVIIVIMMDRTAFQWEDKIVSLALYFVSIAFIYEIFGYVLYKYKTKIHEFRGFLLEMGMLLNDQI